MLRRIILGLSATNVLRAPEMTDRPARRESAAANLIGRGNSLFSI
jgi:hypothetical protein